MGYRSKVALLVVVNIIIWYFFISYGVKPGRLVSTQAVYENKIVYTVNLSENKSPLIKDCKEKKGNFNTCGTACATEEELCTSVCAYTCEW